MTDNIDHAAEAFRVLQLPTSMEDATEANALAYAQVHATLALVAATEKVAEQQRIANLVALATSEYVPLGEIEGLALEDIKKGLGLS